MEGEVFDWNAGEVGLGSKRDKIAKRGEDSLF